VSDANYGTAEEREAIFVLEDRLSAVIETQQLGEHDGNEFGGDEATIYCYGPDADRLFGGIESEARACPARPAFAELRFGAATDPHAPTQRIEL
jgi:hypothetical protein